ncbi:hypothetical protein B0A55_05744 [Friedmanniomyces simplex]|uniref:Major facilitator superfamily (MFS) profile domain-containing protein n=1 Tax=Friedmanniomyces simplex TaxID=329884 RepID=A0A4U0X6I2_9PEZI|nr:hypothetical protein B0A55_05744 [Friedmanniomyces simplex]
MPETTSHPPTPSPPTTQQPQQPSPEPQDDVPPISPTSDSDSDPPSLTHSPTSEIRRIASLNQTVSLPREILVIGLICLSQLLTQVAFGDTLVLLHVIGRSFGVTNAGTEAWDVFGYKRMLVIGYSWFAFWSMVAGLAVYSNYVLFVFARVLQGIGPSICLPNGLALLGALYDAGTRKNMAFAMFGAEAERVAKEELEGMLLVMGDLEAERDGYRGKVRELGGEVSEEEEEEDEEEGAEDGDEDEEEEEGGGVD